MHTPSVLAFAALLGLVLSFPAPPHHDTWRPLAPIPLFARQEHATVFLPPSTIAIIGGIIPNNDTQNIPVETTALMQFYDMDKNSWTTKASLPKPLNHLNAAVSNGRIYVLGGLVEDTSRGRAWRRDASSWVYEPATDTWTRLPSVPFPQLRGSAAVGVHNGKIYLAGGMTDLELSGNFTQASVSVVSIFDTTTHQWLELPHRAQNMPQARDHAGAAVVGETLLVLGGRRDGQENTRDTVFALDLGDLEKGWTIREARMPTARGGLSAAAIGRKVYTFGGEGNGEAESGVFAQVEAYDSVTDTWEKGEPMRLPRHGTYAVAAHGKIYVPGGGVRQGGAPVADFDVFEPWVAQD